MSVTKQTIVRAAIEILIYVVLVSIYLAIILNFCVGWLQELFLKQRAVYAMVTIVLMIAQAFVFERIVSALVKRGPHRTDRSPK